MSVIRIGNCLPESIAAGALAAVPPLSWPFWHRYTGRNGDKYGTVDACRLPANVHLALNTLALSLGAYLPAGAFWDMDLHGAGIHVLPPGGFLERHLDAKRHPIHGWTRTTSAVLFLTSHPDGSGALVLEQSKQVIVPEFNTAVIFDTEEEWHWVRKTVGTRITLALFGWRPGKDGDGTTMAAEFVPAGE